MGRFVVDLFREQLLGPECRFASECREGVGG